MDYLLPLNNPTPLAERIRPTALNDFVGQEHLLGEGKMLHDIIVSGALPSVILWGPPGSGKTSLARIMAEATGAHFVFFSAVLSGVKEVREIVRQANDLKDLNGTATLLFVDEIHRFNKSQQDAFLPHVESGLLTLIGATTENPSFQVIAPLLSRCRTIVLESLSEENLRIIFQRALQDSRGLGEYQLSISDEALYLLAGLADGDARNGLNILEIAATLVIQRAQNGQAHPIDVNEITEAAQRKTLRYDKNGDEHFNLISALHKSLRDSDPDGSLYWFYRMIRAGEDPLYISRRLVRFASEDVGIADPQALVQALAGRSAYQQLGSPEGELALAQSIVYLATAPKSNALYTGAKRVNDVIKKTGSLPVPLHLRNAPTRLMKELGYGKDYQYAHDHADGLVTQTHLPEEIDETDYYRPTNRGYEAIVKDRLEKWHEILKKRLRE